jgi:hypothetical protein
MLKLEFNSVVTAYLVADAAAELEQRIYTLQEDLQLIELVNGFATVCETAEME